ncbi:MAG TPA: hypothetical protein VGH11_00560 [Jatrophihabitans sp.]
MTQQYLAGELSVRLAGLHAVAGDQARGCEIARLRQEAEILPPAALSRVAVRALRLTDALCWDALTRGDTTAFAGVAAISAELREFGVCACLLADA